MPKASFKLPNPGYYLSKLKDMHWIYWVLIAISVSMIVGGLLLFANRQRQLSENNGGQKTEEPAEEEEETPTPPEIKPVKIVFKAKPTQYEIAAGAQAEFIAELIGDNNQPYVTPDPVFLSFSAAPEGQNRKVTGETGGSIFIPRSKSSGKIFMVEEKVGTYTLTLSVDGLQKDTATLKVNAGTIASITVSGPSSITHAQSVSGIQFTATAKDQFGNPLSQNSFNFTITRDSSDQINACNNASSCVLKDNSAGCLRWTVVAKSGTISGSKTVSKSTSSSGENCSYTQPNPGIY